MKNALRALAAAALVAGLVAAPAGTASAEVTCSPDDLVELAMLTTSVSPGPNPIVVGTGPVSMRLGATFDLPCLVTTGVAGVIAPNGDLVETADMSVLDHSGGRYEVDADVVWHTDFLVDADAGRWSSLIAVGDEQGPLALGEGPEFVVKRQSRFVKAAVPSKAKVGKKVTVSSQLSRVSWDRDAFVPLSKQKVTLQFKSKRGVYEKVKTVVSDRRGTVQATVSARQDGCYRFVFAGTSTTGESTSGTDCIDVHRA